MTAAESAALDGLRAARTEELTPLQAIGLLDELKKKLGK